MKNKTILLLLVLFAMTVTAGKPWEKGKLQVSCNQRFLQFENGEPFFWMGETAWLMPERLNREEVSHYLKTCHEAGFNMVQVQVNLHGLANTTIRC